MNVKRSQLKLIVGLAGTLLLTSCQQSLSMWVVPGSTNNSLILGLSTSRDSGEPIQPEDIRVFPCSAIHRNTDGSYYPGVDHAVWAATARYDALPPATNRITYGQGFGTQRAAIPLTAPGCYVVIAYGREAHDVTEVATMGFRIEANGAAVEMSRDEYENIFK